MKSTESLLDSGLLRQIGPMTINGYARFRQVVEQDGALPAKIKALYVAVAATTRGYREMAARELRRAHGLGLSAEEASSALIVLSSARGEGAALVFLGVLEAEYPEIAGVETAMPERSVAPGEAEKNFVAYFGTVPSFLQKLLDLLPLGADAYYLMREGTIGSTALGPRYAELMLVAILAADYSPLASVHMNGARKVGASEVDIAETLICAVLTSGLSAWVLGANVWAQPYSI